MIPAVALPPIKFRPVPRLLDHIGLAMYSNFNKAIAELVVNGYDADATQVAVEISANEIVIRDNGTGMSEDDIRNSYMMLGSETKRQTYSTVQPITDWKQGYRKACRTWNCSSNLGDDYKRRAVLLLRD